MSSVLTEDVERIFGKRPWVSRSQEIIEENAQLLENAEKAENAENTENADNSDAKESETADVPRLEDMPDEVRKAQEDYERSLQSTEEQD